MKRKNLVPFRSAKYHYPRGYLYFAELRIQFSSSPCVVPQWLFHSILQSIVSLDKGHCFETLYLQRTSVQGRHVSPAKKSVGERVTDRQTDGRTFS